MSHALPPHVLHKTKASEWLQENDLVALERIIAGAGWHRVVEFAEYQALQKHFLEAAQMYMKLGLSGGLIFEISCFERLGATQRD